jgi:uncharacterized protein DUF6445
MSIARHRDFNLQRLTIGTERAPLLVIDNVVADPDALVDVAAGKPFANVATYYPGVRAKVPLTVQQFILDTLREEFQPVFGLTSAARFTACHFSIVTTPPDRLDFHQRIPHTDSGNSSELALLLYLFKKDLGGTAFFRHRKTGFEVVDDSRKAEYLRQVEADRPVMEQATMGYIHGDTPFYECISNQAGVFNRMLVYRRTSLHSGALARDFVPNADPRQGRLSINGFIA